MAPPEDWIIVPNAHAALTGDDGAIKIAQARKAVATARQQYFGMTKCFNCTAKVFPDGKSVAGWAWGRGRYAEP